MDIFHWIHHIVSQVLRCRDIQRVDAVLHRQHKRICSRPPGRVGIQVTIGVAKLLKKGNVVGIDIWDKMDIKNVSQERAYQNAAIERVRDKVEFKTGNVLNIPFPDNSFDLVTAGGVLLAFWHNKARLKALAEILRVLRPGGQFLLMETLRNPGTLLICPGMAWKFLTKRICITLLEKTGFINLTYNAYETVMGCFLVQKPKKK